MSNIREKNNPALTVSLSPHIKSPASIARIMWMVVIALIPAMIIAVVVFGPKAASVLVTATATCVLSEFAIETLFFKKRRMAASMEPGRQFIRPSIIDGSAVITGILLGMNLPPAIPLWQVVAGSVFAIGVGKMVFGGLGHNPFNPALVGRAFMLASFPAEMTVFDKPFAWLGEADTLTAATALGTIKEGVAQGLNVSQLAGSLPDHLTLFLGTVGGCLGEVSTLAILIGGLFMLILRVITWETPVFFIGGLALVTGVFWLISPEQYADPLYHLLSGGAMLGAWFMATDMVTSPMSVRGRIVFAIGGGLLTGLIRLFGSYPEGASYAILIMNALVPLIDRNMPPRPFGKQRGGSV